LSLIVLYDHVVPRKSNNFIDKELMILEWKFLAIIVYVSNLLKLGHIFPAAIHSITHKPFSFFLSFRPYISPNNCLLLGYLNIMIPFIFIYLSLASLMKESAI